MEQDPKAARAAIEKESNAYKVLKDIPKSKELDDFLGLLIQTVAEKMVWSFTGENIKNYEDYLKVKGEIVSYLYPIQQIRGADAMVQHLDKQLKEYYT